MAGITYVIRRIGPADRHFARQAILNIKHHSMPRAANDFDDAYLAKLLTLAELCFLVAVTEETVVGFLIAYRLPRVDRLQNMMFLYEIEVAAAYQKKGIGTGLINTLKLICRNEQIMKVWVPTHRSNTAAVNLYKKTGGQEDGDGEMVSFTYYPPFVDIEGV